MRVSDDYLTRLCKDVDPNSEPIFRLTLFTCSFDKSIWKWRVANLQLFTYFLVRCLRSYENLPDTWSRMYNACCSHDFI